MTHKTANEALQPLIGLPLRCLGRAANMLWVQFGEMRESVSPLGRSRQTSEWALHVQCVWRLCGHGRIALGYRDFYYSPARVSLDDWSTLGKSQFDVIADSLNHAFSTTPPRVLSFASDDTGGFSLHLTDDFRLDVFPESSQDGECWRLFQLGTDLDHFVF